MEVGFIVAVYLCAFVCCVVAPHVGLGLCCAIQVFASVSETWNEVALQWLLTGAFLLGFYQIWRSHRPRVMSGWAMAICCAGAWTVMSGVLTQNGTGAPFRHAVDFALPLLWGCISGSSSRAKRGWFVGLLVATTANFLAMFNPGGYFSFREAGIGYEYAGITRAAAITSLHSTSLLAGFLLISLIGVVVDRVTRPPVVGTDRLLGTPVSVVASVAILGTVALLVRCFSRGTLIGVSSGLLLLPILYARHRPTGKGRVVCAVGLLTIALALFIVSQTLSGNLTIGERYLESLRAAFSFDESNQYRLRAAEEALVVLAAEPLWGIGTPAFWQHDLNYPHQLPLSFALSYGIPVGVVVMALLMAGVVRSSILALRRKMNLRPSVLDGWFLLALSLVNLSAAMTNGARASGCGFQWWAIGACVCPWQVVELARRRGVPASHLARQEVKV